MKELDKKALLDWEQFKSDVKKATPPEKLSAAEKARKKAYLEKHPVEWMQYFFPNYASCPFAPFQKEAINRICRNDEWYEVWSWSRELAKSTVSMMLELYLMLTGRKRYLLMVSATQDSAVRLLAPYRANLEANGRIIDFYGEQQSLTKWEETNFVTRSNLTFLAVGYGNAPRGTRNESIRPDIIDIDDYDTDKDCRNPVILDKKTEFIERAVITEADAGSLVRSQPVVLTVKVGELDLLRRHSALAADHIRQGAFKTFYEIRALAHITGTSLAGTGDRMQHKAGVPGHMQRLAAKGYDAGDGGSQAVYVYVDIGRAVLQGIENGNAGEDLSAHRVDMYVDVRVFLGEIVHLGDNPLRVDAFSSDLPVNHYGDGAVPVCHDIEKLPFGHRCYFWFLNFGANMFYICLICNYYNYAIS